jgi:hypothetical protein
MLVTCEKHKGIECKDGIDLRVGSINNSSLPNYEIENVIGRLLAGERHDTV